MATFKDLVYAGFVKQSAKGSSAAPTKFLKIRNAAFFPSQKISDYRNGNVSDINFSLKETFHYNGAIKTFGYGDELTALLAHVMGTDTKTGAGDPYTHTLSFAEDLPWLSVEVAYNELQVIDRVIDCKVGRIVIDAEAGKPVEVTADLYGSSVAAQGSAATVTFNDGATEGPLMFHQAAFTLTGPSDAATIQGQIQKLTLEIQRNISVEYGPGAVYPLTLKETARLVSAKISALFSSSAIHNLTHYGSSSGTSVSPVLGTGSLVAAFTPTAASPGPERSITLTLNQGTWQLAKSKGNADAKPASIDLELVGYRSGATLPLTVVSKNGVSTAYAP